MLKRALAGVAVAIMLAGAAMAGPSEHAIAAYQRGDYATALRLSRPLAEQGNASGQNNLGLMYDSGHGVPQDYAEAVKWYRLAADQGFAPAMFSLGVVYEQGKGVTQDRPLAYTWFDLAAARGDTYAARSSAQSPS